jgi:hypothetical protein
MIRVLLPLAVIATLLFAPMYAEESSEVAGILKSNTVTGMDYVGPPLQCWTGGNISIEDDCAPAGGNIGLALLAAVAISGIAAALGVIGLVPVLGRLTSLVTTFAGVVVLAAVAFYMLANLDSDSGLAGVQWGTYLAGGGGLLTIISGLSGMRGR